MKAAQLNSNQAIQVLLPFRPSAELVAFLETQKFQPVTNTLWNVPNTDNGRIQAGVLQELFHVQILPTSNAN